MSKLQNSLISRALRDAKHIFILSVLALSLVSPLLLPPAAEAAPKNPAQRVASARIVNEPIVPSGAIAAPTNTSPSDNAVLPSSSLTKMDWSDIDHDSPLTYSYELSLSNDTSSPTGAFESVVTRSAGLMISEIAVNALPDGVYYWHAKACDTNSRCSDWSSTWKVTVDSTVPTVTIAVEGISSVDEYPGAYVSTNLKPTISGTVDDPDAKLTLLIQNGSEVSTIHPLSGTNWSYTPSGNMDQGIYTVQIIATDAAGNTGTASSRLIIDNKIPDTPVLTSPTDGTVTNDATPVITGQAAPLPPAKNPTTQYQIQIMSTADPANSTIFTTNGSDAFSFDIPDDAMLADGTYSVRIRAVDAYGGKSSWSTPATFTVDTTAPDIVITSPENGQLINGAVAISGVVSGSIDYELTIRDSDGATVFSQTDTDGSFSYFWDTMTVADGDYTITVTATDAASNTGKKSVVVIVDNTAPGVPAQLGPGDGTAMTSSSQPQLSWSAVPDISMPVTYGIEVSSDATFAATLLSSDTADTTFAVTGLGEGTYFWRVRACDALGNCSGWSGAWRFVIDDTPPVVVVTESHTTDSTPTITGTVNERDAVITVKVGGITYAAVVSTVPNGLGTYNWSVQVTNTLDIGPHSITAFARDKLGNSKVHTSIVTVITPLGGLASNTVSSQSVLAADIKTPANSQTAQKDTPTTHQTNNTAFLGLGWWWLPLLIPLAGGYYIARQRFGK